MFSDDAETKRLATLTDYGILDTPPEADFDDIAHAAAYVCDTPIALVSLVQTDRQWFKARLGIDVCETPISQSVCALGLRQTDLLVIPDLTKDDRTCLNELVSGDANLRFYAGAPLIAPNGDVLGMLCVIDTVPRPDGLTSQQRSILAGFARQVISQLELRLTLARHAEVESQRRLLNEELSHRLKNTLALVQGIANQTLRTVDDRSAVEAFDARLLALSTAHDILLQDNWAAARLHAIIKGGTAVHGRERQVRVEGADIMCGPRAALSIAMLLHELTTNAIKYGSLSLPSGKVTIRLSVERDEEPRLILKWIESGGPVVTAPKTRSFGARLINMGIAGTRDVTESFLKTGYEVVFRAPLSRLREGD